MTLSKSLDYFIKERERYINILNNYHLYTCVEHLGISLLMRWCEFHSVLKNTWSSFDTYKYTACTSCLMYSDCRRSRCLCKMPYILGSVPLNQPRPTFFFFNLICKKLVRWSAKFKITSLKSLFHLTLSLFFLLVKMDFWLICKALLTKSNSLIMDDCFPVCQELMTDQSSP